MKFNKLHSKITLIPIFLTLQYGLFAQFSIVINTNPVSQTIFCQSKYSKKIILNDTLDVFARMNFSCIEIKFPGKDWIPSCYPLQDPEDGDYISTSESGGYVNLLPIFFKDTSLLSAFGNSGTLIELRYRLNANVEEAGFLKYYSNIDTVYLPPATSNDISALWLFTYLRYPNRQICMVAASLR